MTTVEASDYFTEAEIDFVAKEITRRFNIGLSRAAIENLLDAIGDIDWPAIYQHMLAEQYIGKTMLDLVIKYGTIDNAPDQGAIADTQIEADLKLLRKRSKQEAIKKAQDEAAYLEQQDKAQYDKEMAEIQKESEEAQKKWAKYSNPFKQPCTDDNSYTMFKNTYSSSYPISQTNGAKTSEIDNVVDHMLNLLSIITEDYTNFEVLDIFIKRSFADKGNYTLEDVFDVEYKFPRKTGAPYLFAYYKNAGLTFIKVHYEVFKVLVMRAYNDICIKHVDKTKNMKDDLRELYLNIRECRYFVRTGKTKEMKPVGYNFFIYSYLRVLHMDRRFMWIAKAFAEDPDTELAPDTFFEDFEEELVYEAASQDDKTSTAITVTEKVSTLGDHCYFITGTTAEKSVGTLEAALNAILKRKGLAIRNHFYCWELTKAGRPHFHLLVWTNKKDCHLGQAIERIVKKLIKQAKAPKIKRIAISKTKGDELAIIEEAPKPGNAVSATEIVHCFNGLTVVSGGSFGLAYKGIGDSANLNGFASYFTKSATDEDVVEYFMEHSMDNVVMSPGAREILGEYVIGSS